MVTVDIVWPEVKGLSARELPSVALAIRNIEVTRKRIRPTPLGFGRAVARS
jgi:hypothetical protein